MHGKLPNGVVQSQKNKLHDLLVRNTCVKARFQKEEISKGLAKRSQHFNATSCNMAGHNMLRSFGHPVAICCNLLDDVGSDLKGLGHAILGNFSTDRMVIELTKILK